MSNLIKNGNKLIKINNKLINNAASSSETWVLNDQLTITSAASFTIDFVSNNQNFNMFKLSIEVVGPNATLIYRNVPESSITAYNNGNWNDFAYKTVTFATTPTGDLLTWLQANGVKKGGNITLPEVDNMLDFTNITYCDGFFTGAPTFSSTLNNARIINVGAKGYELLSKANDINVEPILSDLINPFNITKTNKDNDFISTDWGLNTMFEYRLTDESGNNGGILIEWSAEHQSLLESIADDILILKYNAIDDTLTVCELDSLNGSTGELTVHEEVGYYDVLAIALKIN